MNIEPIIFFEMAAIIVVFAIALLGVVFIFTRTIKKLHSTQESSESVDSARQKAVKIIDDANSKAMDIINKTNLSTNIASDNFNQEVKRIASLQIKEFEKATSDFLKLYTQILQDLKSKNIEVFQNVSKDIEVNTMTEIKNFIQSMGELTASSQKLVKKKIDADYLSVKKEIETYKEEELKKVDQQIYELLEKVSKLALGKALSLSEHEDLIEKSLEKAKKEGTFD
ncbi:MAG: hypothetical protein HYW62_01920 [Candidatus Levybacteria bacterium]|nr:hypothetical protein [Candidatus Levybacteria bacterium]